MSVQVKGSGTIGGLDEGLVVSGIVTSSTQINVGSNIKIGSAGVVTATSFVGSGANLTGITQTTINSNTNNYLITGTGTANTLQGEANFTYNGGNNLTLNSTAHDGGFNILAANNNQETRFRIQGKASDGTGHSFYLNAKRSSNRLDIAGGAGANLTIMGSTKNVGVDNTGPESPLQIGGGTNPMTAKPTLHVAPSSGNASMSLRGGSPSIYFDGTGGGHTRFLTDGTDIAISTGNLDSAGSERFRFRSSGGLCFNGDTAAANALDDYEEGSYVVTVTGSGGGSFALNPNSFRYTKIGRVVHVTGRIYVVSGSPTGAECRVSLPFTSAPDIQSQDGRAFSYVSTYNAYSPNNDYQMSFSVLPNSSYGVLLWIVPNAVWQSVSPSSHMNQRNAYYGFDFSYTVAT